MARIREQGALSALPYALAGLSFAEFFLGHWRAAYALATESRALADEVGQHLMSPMTRLVIALIAGAQGRLGEAREQIEHASAVVDHGVESMITMTTWARGKIELAAGNYDEAIATLAPAGRFNLERDALVEGQRASEALLEVLVACEQPAAALGAGVGEGPIGALGLSLEDLERGLRLVD